MDKEIIIEIRDGVVGVHPESQQVNVVVMDYDYPQMNDTSSPNLLPPVGEILVDDEENEYWEYYAENSPYYILPIAYARGMPGISQSEAYAEQNEGDEVSLGPSWGPDQLPEVE